MTLRRCGTRFIHLLSEAQCGRVYHNVVAVLLLVIVRIPAAGLQEEALVVNRRKRSAEYVWGRGAKLRYLTSRIAYFHTRSLSYSVLSDFLFIILRIALISLLDSHLSKYVYLVALEVHR